jgi:co-chaperonin GroES (HSP10)
MKDKILSRTRIGEYVANAWDGENRSGITPIGDQVLVLPDAAPEQTKGGVYIDETTRERMSGAAETGVIIEIGDGAWSWNMDRTRRFEGARPVVGQRVCFTRYAGLEVFGDDGQLYRLMSDNCIGGLRAPTPQIAATVERIALPDQANDPLIAA